jgi:hypothetical protein
MATCKVDDTALRKCQEGQAALIQVFKERAAETARRDKLLRDWTIADAAWNTEHERQLALREAGRQAGGSEIWYGNVKYDCSK